MRPVAGLGLLVAAASLVGCTAGEGDTAGGSGSGGSSGGSTVQVPGLVLRGAGASIVPPTASAGRVAAPCHERVCVWSTGGELLSSDWVEPDAGVTATAWSPDGATLAAATADTVLLLDAETGEQVDALDLGGPAATLAYAPDGSTLAAATPTGVVLLPADGGASTTLAAGDDVLDLDWSPDGTRVAVALRDAPAEILDTTTGSAVTLDGEEASRVAFARGGREVATATGTEVVVHDAATGEAGDTVDGLGATVTDVAYAQGADDLAIATEDNLVRLRAVDGRLTTVGDGVAPTRALLWSGTSLYGSADDEVSEWSEDDAPRGRSFDRPPFE